MSELRTSGITVRKTAFLYKLLRLRLLLTLTVKDAADKGLTDAPRGHVMVNIRTFILSEKIFQYGFIKNTLSKQTSLVNKLGQIFAY